MGRCERELLLCGPWPLRASGGTVSVQDPSSIHPRRAPHKRTPDHRRMRDTQEQEMSSADTAEPAREPLAGGRLLAEITNRIVALIREHYGRGPIEAKTYVLENLIVCVLSDGFTPIEQTMMEGGESERVLEMRRDFQRLMKTRYSEMVEELTGRKLLAFLSQAHIEPDLTVEMFLTDGPVPGFGALELVDPGDP